MPGLKVTRKTVSRGRGVARADKTKTNVPSQKKVVQRSRQDSLIKSAKSATKAINKNKPLRPKASHKVRPQG